MLAKVKTGAITGLDALPVDVEVEIQGGKEKFTVIGLVDSAIRESRDRVAAALQQAGFRLPDQVLVNLAPAELKKEGSSFDLPIAVAILAAMGKLPLESLEMRSFHGELSLDGSLKPVRGGLAFAIEAMRAGLREIILPTSNANEASLISGIQVVPVSSLQEVISYIRDGSLFFHQRDASSDRGHTATQSEAAMSLADVWGQKSAKRALLIAAAGAHNLLMIGPPGCGKSMLAERFPLLLPPLSHDEILETVRIHSISGISVEPLLRGVRPFRSPHHVVSEPALIGGGSMPRPGEISLAHRGVLFLDEFPEYRRGVLEALRVPLETGAVRISRAKSSVKFPSRFQLIAAMNPCPCGRRGVPGASCLCSPSFLQSYYRRLSQPILERIDLHVELQPVPTNVMLSPPCSREAADEAGSVKLVVEARERQRQRQGTLNSTVSGQALLRERTVRTSAQKLLEIAADRHGLSARTFVRILRVAATIADLEAADEVDEAHVAEAIQFRCLERLFGTSTGGRPSVSMNPQ